MDFDLKNYFQYIKDVLGVKSVLLERVEIVSPWGVYIEDYPLYNKNEKDLLLKMLQAVNLSENDYKIYDINSLEQTKYQHQNVFCFFNQPENHSSTYKSTFSPRTLLVRTDLKRAAWDVMKSHFLGQK